MRIWWFYGVYGVKWKTCINALDWIENKASEGIWTIDFGYRNDEMGMLYNEKKTRV